MSCIFIYFDDLCLLIREVIALIFNVITDVVRFGVTILLFVFYLLLLFVVSLFFSCLSGDYLNIFKNSRLTFL